MTDCDLSPYSRQVMLPEIGTDGQKRIMQSSVLVVGLGGLGCPVALYLAGAGVGRMGLADADTVSESNLHRQLLYDAGDVGRLKTEAAAERLSKISPGARFDLYDSGINRENAMEIVARYDLVVDCCDNFATRYLLDDTCLALGRTWVCGAISGFGGMATVFTPGSRTRYRDLYPDRDEMSRRPAASEGVIGPTPGVLGSVQAAEAFKILAGLPPSLDGRLLCADLLAMDFNIIDL